MTDFGRVETSDAAGVVSRTHDPWRKRWPPPSRCAEPGPDLEAIIGTVGDAVRGRKPFPHPFPARMPLEVARAAVRLLSEPGDTVLDPMAGSGVVLKAALCEGRHAIGSDVDPLAVIQAKALCSAAPCDELTVAAQRVLEDAVSMRKHGATTSRWDALAAEDRKFIAYWFEERHADELFALGLALEQAKHHLHAPLAAMMSSLVISRGSGASRAMDLSRSRPHRVDAKVPRSPFEHWGAKRSAFLRYYEAQGRHDSRFNVSLGDARDLAIADESVDAVITSPPYVNAIDYMRISKFTLVFLGNQLADLRRVRATAIGTEVGLRPGSLPADLDKLVDDKVSDPRRRPMLRRYLSDLLGSLIETKRVLKPGAHALYVMGPSVLSRRDYDAAQVMNAIAVEAGLHPVSHGRRDLVASRRSLPPPRRSRRDEPVNKRMSCELFVLLRKDPG